jgi:hypothetical protein
MRGSGAGGSRSAPPAAPAKPPGTGRLLDYYCTCTPGLEAVVAAELASPHIGALNVQPGRAGVTFQGSLQTGATTTHLAT